MLEQKGIRIRGSYFPCNYMSLSCCRGNPREFLSVHERRTSVPEQQQRMHSRGNDLLLTV